ncbi:ATP-binding protein [Rhizocola hellebori]|uniref:ATP-binding protein n=1 Tax=Rhizocola hellebori TaxID=1392758 RepID=UPI00357145E4
MSSVTPVPSWFRFDEESVVGAARRYAVEVAQALQLSERKVADLAIVVTELGTNLIKHATEGVLLVRPVREVDNAGLEVVSVDAGPGIADLTRFHRDGHTTAGSLGIGLGAVARLADRYDVYSTPGRGTVLIAQMWQQQKDPPSAWAEGLTRPMTGEHVTGDGYAIRREGNRSQVLVCDGLGHGPLAAAATQAALHIFGSAPMENPAALVNRLHRGLSHTRGAALLVAQIDPDEALIRVCGLGNIAGTILNGHERRGVVSMPGIAGHGKATIREFEYPCTPHSLLVAHSDGVSDKWSLDGYPGLESRSPLLIAATVLRDAGVRRDDACVLAARTHP